MVTENTKFKCMLDYVRMDRKPVNGFYDLQHRLGSNPTEVSIEELANAIGQGKSFRPAVLEGITNEAWRNQQCFGIDIDNKEEIQTEQQILDKCDEYGLIPNILYYTFSHTEEKPRFRVLFVTDIPTSNYQQAQQIRYGLTELFKSDSAPKNANTMFYGSALPAKVLSNEANKLSTLFSVCDNIVPTIVAVSNTSKVKHHSITGTLPVGHNKSARIVKNFDWLTAKENSALLKAFFNGERIHYNDLKILASNAKVIDNGIDVLQAVIVSNASIYEPYHQQLLINYSVRNYKPESFLTCSYVEDRQYTSFEDIVKKAKYASFRKAPHQYITEQIDEATVRSWNKAQPIFIQAGTGTGKSYFAVNMIGKICKELSEERGYTVKALICQNRKCAREQIYANDVKRLGYEDYIHVICYQGYDKAFDYSMYEYVINDEAHFFQCDSTFNPKAEEPYLALIEKAYNKCILIFMTATVNHNTTVQMLNEDYPNMITYKFNDYYNHISKAVCYNGNNYIGDMLKKLTATGQKALVFVDNIDRLSEMYDEYSSKGMFYCSDSQLSKYTKRRNKKRTITTITGEQVVVNDDYHFTQLKDTGLLPDGIQFLFATSAMDTGFSIKDTDVKHIFCESIDLNKVVQWVGRYRVTLTTDANGQRVPASFITIHIKNVNKYSLNEVLFKDFNTIESNVQSLMVDKILGTDSYNLTTQRIKQKETIIRHIEKGVFEINKCGYKIFQFNKEFYTGLVNHDVNWKNELETQFQIQFIDNDEETDKAHRLAVLSKYVNVKLTSKKMKKEFFEEMKIYEKRANRERFLVSKANVLNTYINQMGYKAVEGKLRTGDRYLVIQTL